jgi:hypothetical protein
MIDRHQKGPNIFQRKVNAICFFDGLYFINFIKREVDKIYCTEYFVA